MVTEPYGFVINNKNRRVLFEQVQHNGDCSVNGGLRRSLKPLAEKQLTFTTFRR